MILSPTASQPRMKAGVALVVVALLASLTGCAAATTDSESPSLTSPAVSVEPGANLARARVSYVAACPDLIKHVQANTDLVLEFVNNSHRLAEWGAATTARFDAVIEDMEYDRKVAPEPLIPFISAQLETMKGLRDYLRVGGTRNNDFREYRSAGFEITKQCSGIRLPIATTQKSEYPKEVPINSLDSRFRTWLGSDRGKTMAVQLAAGVYAEQSTSGELGTLDDYSAYVGLCVDVNRYAAMRPGGHVCW